MLIRICGAVALLLAMAGQTAADEPATIENETLRATISSGGELAIIDKASGKKFASVMFGEDCQTAGGGRGMAVVTPDSCVTNLYLLPRSPFLTIYPLGRHTGDEPLVVSSLDGPTFDIDLGVPPSELRSYGTGFLKTLDQPTTSFSVASVVEPKSRAGVVVAQCTHEFASCVFTTKADGDRVSIATRHDFGRLQVEPHEEHELDLLLIGYFADARLGLEAYADVIAKDYEIKLKPQPGVYCTWYHAGASNEKALAENAAFAEKHLAPWGLDVMQIDDKWQRLTPSFCEPENQKRGSGPVKTFVESNDNYPNGMAVVAEDLEAKGLTAGLWFMPFAGGYRTSYFQDKQDLFAHWPDGTPIEDPRWSGTLLDCSNPKTREFVHERVKRIYDWGYRYFKIDGLHTGAVTHNVYVNTDWSDGGFSNSRNFIGTQAAPGKSDSDTPSAALHDPTMTHIEAFRAGLDTLRDAAPDAFVLGCNVSQNMRSMGASFGRLDAMRIGPDNGGGGQGRWGDVTLGAKHGTNLYFLNGRVWHNDPDPVYVRESNPLEKARWMVSWVAVTGSMLTTSEQFSTLPPERLDLLRRTLPSVFQHTRCGDGLVARPVDLFERENARIWLLTDTRKPVRRDVIGLFNWDENEATTIEYPLERMGLASDGPYVAFDFWADRFVEPFEGSLRQTLPGGTCRVLTVRPVSDHPLLLSTSRHITQGVIDVLEETWDADWRTLKGRSVVVAGDPYELRIALPKGGEWEVADALVEGCDASIAVGEANDLGVRVTITPKTSGEVAWRVVFKQ